MRTSGIETQRDKNTGRYLYIKVNTVIGKRYYYNKTYFIGLIGSGGFKQTHKLVLSSKNIACCQTEAQQRQKENALN